MKTNAELQKDVQDAIKWEPHLHAAEIGASVHNGVVTLTGTVDSYPKKLEAEAAVKNVIGVKALVENIQVDFGSRKKETDTDIADEVLATLIKNWEVPADKIKVKVEKGLVSLSGEVPWNFQKEAAGLAVNHLPGVKIVLNEIVVNPHSKDCIEQQSIESAFSRNSALDASEIRVSVTNNGVTLNGLVDSWSERAEAERTAWKTPGVTSVQNELIIDYDYD